MYTCSGQNIQGLLVCFSGLLNKLIPFTALLALLYFLWGVLKIIRAQGDTDAIEEGKRTAIWGIVALFIIASVGGIIVFLQQDILSNVSNGL